VPLTINIVVRTREMGRKSFTVSRRPSRQVVPGLHCLQNCREIAIVDSKSSVGYSMGRKGIGATADRAIRLIAGYSKKPLFSFGYSSTQ
jgi:hypothetical protein